MRTEAIQSLRGIRSVVNGQKWSGPRLIHAINDNRNERPIELLIADGDDLRTIQLQYYDGPRYWNLVRQEDEPDLLKEILTAK